MPDPQEDLVVSHLDEDRVLDLLLDLLPAPELEAAGRHLASCERCEELLRRRGALLERQRASHEQAALLGFAAVPEQPANQQGESETVGPRRRAARKKSVFDWEWAADAHRWFVGALRRPAYAIGLGGGILAVIGLLLLTANPKKTIPYPTSAKWLPSAAETLNLRNNAGRAADLADALTAYDRRDLPTAIHALSTVEASGAIETMRLVYLGSSFTQAGEYERAVQVLRSLPLTRLPEPWRGESYWTLLVALHGAGDKAAADSLLRALADQTDVIGARARRLLGRPNP